MQCAEFEILDDDIYESVETFTLALNITQQAVGIHIGDSTVSIHDNDHVNISFQSAAYSVVEGEGSVGVCMDLRGRTERNVPILVRTTSLTAQGWSGITLGEGVGDYCKLHFIRHLIKSQLYVFISAFTYYGIPLTIPLTMSLATGVTHRTYHSSCRGQGL